MSALTWDGTSVYAGLSGVGSTVIARWDGSSWIDIAGALQQYERVAALAWDGTNLYAALDEERYPGNTYLGRVARWDGSRWTEILPQDAEVMTLAWDGMYLYVGGLFQSAGGLPAVNIARWDGVSWSPVGGGIGGSPSAVTCIHSDGTGLYVGGYFDTAGGMPAANVARWDGIAWSNLGSGTGGPVVGLASAGGILYAGGSFGTAGGDVASAIARWDGAAWGAVFPPGGEGVTSGVAALAWDGSMLYAGGSFDAAGAVPAANVARWDGSSWSALGSGIDGYVTALAWTGTEMFAAGGFLQAGGVPASHVARWDGSVWLPLDSGTDGSVMALAWDGSRLYAGGYFASAGSVPAAGIASWDGTAWSALGAGVERPPYQGGVYALAWNGESLTVGGHFTMAGGAPASNIAQWEGGAWSSLGSGMDDDVGGLVWDGSRLYAAGSFISAGGVSAMRVARWDGAEWSALGTGLDDRVYSLDFVDGNLIAVGRFATAGGVPAPGIARWNGYAWSPFGSGLDGFGRAVSGSAPGRSVFVGGGFGVAGGRPSQNVARYQTCLSILPPSLPRAELGSPYAVTLDGRGGQPPYTFFQGAGTLPTGLVLSTTGSIDGIPSSGGSYGFVVSATDSPGCAGSQGYVIEVCYLSIQPSRLSAGILGEFYSDRLRASGPGTHLFAVESGALPPGLTLYSDGLVAGIPTIPGTFGVTVATEAGSRCGLRTYSILIMGGGQGENLLLGQGLGSPGPNRVKVQRQDGSATGVDFLAYDAGRGGVNVAAAGIAAGATDQILTGPGPGPTLGPHVRAFQSDGTAIAKVQFFAFATPRFGVNLGSGDIDGDGFDEILAGPGPGASFGPHVRGFDYDATSVEAIARASFYAYATLQMGANVAAGEMDADGYDEIVTAPGPGPVFGAHVRGFDIDGARLSPIARLDYMAFTGPQHGAHIGAGDVDADGFDELAAAPGPGPTRSSRFLGYDYDGARVVVLPGFDVIPFVTTGGGRVGLGDVNGDGTADLLAGAGRVAAASAVVRPYVYSGGDLVPLFSFDAFPGGSYGVTADAGRFGF